MSTINLILCCLYIGFIGLVLVNNLMALHINSIKHKMGKEFSKPPIFKLSCSLTMVVLNIYFGQVYKDAFTHSPVWFMDMYRTWGSVSIVLLLMVIVGLVLVVNRQAVVPYGPRIVNYRAVQRGELGWLLGMVIVSLHIPFMAILHFFIK